MASHSFIGSASVLFDGINECTVPGIGITRASYGPEETLAFAFVEGYLEALGLKPWRDPAGNLHARLVGIAEGPDVVIGSHLDSVPSGGRYDGVAGVVAGLLVIERCVREGRVPPHPIRLIVLRGEESAWFGKCYLGSSALFGRLPKEALGLRDRSRECDLRAAILACGGDPERVAAGERFLEPSSVRRFYEAHIEQGPVLDEADEAVAVVTDIRGNRRHPACVITGESGHSGTMPKYLRKDPVLAAAKFLSLLEEAWCEFEHDGRDLVFTCGMAGTDPATHAISVIPGMMKFAFEYRSADADVLEEFEAVVRDLAARISLERGVVIDLGPPSLTEPVCLQRSVIDGLMTHANAVAGIARAMPSGAGHDAAVFQAEGIPTGMIFIRNRHGSHNPQEDMRLDDFVLAVEVLWRAAISDGT